MKTNTAKYGSNGYCPHKTTPPPKKVKCTVTRQPIHNSMPTHSPGPHAFSSLSWSCANCPIRPRFSSS
jgi:hypothetical protein